MGMHGRMALLLAACLLAAPQSSRADELDLHVGIGNFKPASDSTLMERDALYSLELGFRWRPSRHLAGQLGYLYYSQSVATPAAFGAACNSSAELTTSGVGALVKLVQPVGPFDLYAGAGAGWYKSELSTNCGTPGVPFSGRSVSRGDDGIGMQYVAGIDIRASDGFTLGVQYRRLDLDADFGSGIGNAKVGGSMWQVFLRWVLGQCPDCRR